MAKPTLNRSSTPLSPRPDVPPEVIDPRWLAKVLGIVVGVAATSAYLSLCFLIYQGAWQLLLHPSPKVDRTPAALSVPFDTVRFDAAATGRPRLSAWWIPSSSPGTVTILYLHDGIGSLSATVDQLASLHQANVNILALDYRGFGASEPTHPNQVRMTEDANAALEYLTDTRHLDPATIVPYGVGLGAALAASLAANHPGIPAVVIDNPDPDAAARIIQDNRSRLIPVRLLIRDQFDLETPLEQFRGPKLLLVGGAQDKHPTRDARTHSLFMSLPDPKYTVTLPPGPSDLGRVGDIDPGLEAIRRFLDQTLTLPTKK